MADDDCKRLMGTGSNHALKLKQHLYDQMEAQSEFCDVTLTFSGVVCAPVIILRCWIIIHIQIINIVKAPLLIF